MALVATGLAQAPDGAPRRLANAVPQKKKWLLGPQDLTPTHDGEQRERRAKNEDQKAAATAGRAWQLGPEQRSTREKSRLMAPLGQRRLP